MGRKKEQKNNMQNENDYEDNYKTRKKDISQKIILFFVFIIIAVIAVLFSPAFSAKNIDVTKCDAFTKAEILEKIGVNSNTNIILFGKNSAEKTLKTSPYIEDCDISIKFPNTLKIDIKERKIRGYVPYMGSYLYIDEYGRILDVQSAYIKILPIVTGLKFDSFQLGEILETENKESLDVVVKIAQMMTKYNLLDLVVKLDVTNPKEIYAYVNLVDVKLGDIEDIDQKMRILAEIIKKIAKEDRGTLDLSDMTKPIIFRYLT